jgi:hypothetical protein
MTQQLVNIGTTPNDGTGDTLRDAFDKANDNFTELYTDKAAIAGQTFTGTITIPTLNLTNALGVAYGGTGAASTSGVGGALDNLLPSGETSGYVLKTSGAGTYYWGAETGAGGTVGTKIDTTRQSYTATAGQTVFDLSSTTYTPGSGQLRVYINGVRQHPAAYTETDTNTFTLSTGVSVGTLVFAEVDGYVSYPIAATDISYSPAGGSSIAGGTVQLAITELESEKAALTVTTLSSLTSIGSLTSLTVSGTTTLQQTTELLNTKTSATGTVAHDFSTGAVFYHSSISANFTANFTNVPTTNNRTIVVSLILAQGVTARIPSAVQIDGSAQTIKWQDNTVPTGNASKVDIVSFSLIRTGSAWTVLGGLSTYG